MHTTCTQYNELIAAVSLPPVLLVQVHTLSGSCGQIFPTSTTTSGNYT